LCRWYSQIAWSRPIPYTDREDRINDADWQRYVLEHRFGVDDAQVTEFLSNVGDEAVNVGHGI
jgi:hypothetical protein